MTADSNRVADQDRAPLFETLDRYAKGGIYPLHTPAHKGGRFADADLAALLGNRGLELDLPGMTATDNTFHPTGCVRDAQALAADLVGAQESFFLAAGSSLGVATALMAAVPPGATVACVRNIHRSVVAGLVLSGARPRFMSHPVLTECGALGVPIEELQKALDADPKPAAVLFTRPSYYGIARDITEHVALCRSRGVPLIVDEAHGGHFAFLPGAERPGYIARPSLPNEKSRPGFPQPALAAGADLVIQSWHKTVGSLVGSAMLHVGHQSPVSPTQVRDALNFLQTTSPSYLLMASLDLVRRRMAREGQQLFAQAVDEARQLEQQIEQLPGLRVMRPENDPRMADHLRDPLRLVVNVAGAGWTGYDFENYLRTEFQVEDEMSDWSSVVYILSPQDDPAARQRLLAGLRSISESKRAGASPPLMIDADELARLMQPTTPPLAMLPRDAALAPKHAVPLESAAGQTCAEMVMFYPPGIPLLMPGETITEEAISACGRLLAAGAHPYASDTSLVTVRVVQ
ncbi:MAG: aminotransferase class I/II-fold pyridoxal phosphate-dependent enzyme [Pirellulales bacterium]